jgi:hypothetical protein
MCFVVGLLCSQAKPFRIVVIVVPGSSRRRRRHQTFWKDETFSRAITRSRGGQWIGGGVVCTCFVEAASGSAAVLFGACFVRTSNESAAELLALVSLERPVFGSGVFCACFVGSTKKLAAVLVGAYFIGSDIESTAVLLVLVLLEWPVSRRRCCWCLFCWSGQ